MPTLRYQQGFSLLEVIIAMSIAALLSSAVLKLQLISLENSRQAIIRQHVISHADSFINQLKILPSHDINNLAEMTYILHSNQYVKCAKALCNTQEFSKYLLDNFKQNLDDGTVLSKDKIKSIICHDSSFATPTLDLPNCDGYLDSPLVLKVIWKVLDGENSSQFSTLKDNHIILRVSNR